MSEKNKIQTRFKSIARFVFVLSLLFPMANAFAGSDAQTQALDLYNRITQVPLSLSNPLLGRMTSLIQQQQYMSAASLASAERSFANVALLNFVNPLCSRSESPDLAWNDCSITAIGQIIQFGYGNLGIADSRTLLSGNYFYSLAGVTPAANAKDNGHYAAAEALNIDLSVPNNLVRVSPQVAGVGGSLADADAGGIQTTRAYAVEEMLAGTNNRVVEYAFRNFGCVPLKSVAGLTAAANRIPVYVSDPDPVVLTQKCYSCHKSNLGGLVWATGFFEATGNLASGQLLYKSGNDANGVALFDSNKIAKKLNKIPANPSGTFVTDVSWENHNPPASQSIMGWRGNLSGVGMSQFGAMFAHSFGFSACMTKRIYSQVCLKKIFNPISMSDQDYATIDAEDSLIRAIASDFETKGNYSLRWLFDRVAVSCMLP